MEGRIEDTVDLNLKYPSVSERYWTKFYFIPKDKRRQGGNEKGPREDTGDGGGGVVAMRDEGSEKGEDGNGVGVLKGDGGIEKEENSLKKEDNGGRENKNGTEAEKNGRGTEKMDIDYTNTEITEAGDDKSPEDDSSLSLGSQQEGEAGKRKRPDSTGHVCVMVHTNKLCLVTLSPKHPAMAPGMEITEVCVPVSVCLSVCFTCYQLAFLQD